jgi:ligand-binding sensor domain-containing protein
VRALCEDAGGHLWAGTTHGISRYYSEADPDPPKTFILPMPEREKNVPDGGSITIAFDGQDKWKHTARQRLLYSCRLDQREWSP